jgi:hypothetical protein
MGLFSTEKRLLSYIAMNAGIKKDEQIGCKKESTERIDLPVEKYSSSGSVLIDGLVQKWKVIIVGIVSSDKDPELKGKWGGGKKTLP